MFTPVLQSSGRKNNTATPRICVSQGKTGDKFASFNKSSFKNNSHGKGGTFIDDQTFAGKTNYNSSNVTQETKEVKVMMVDHFSAESSMNMHKSFDGLSLREVKEITNESELRDY